MTGAISRCAFVALSLAVAGLPFGHRRGAADGPSGLGAIRCPDSECGHLYDPAIGEPEQGIPPGIAFADLPADWACPVCGTPKHLW